MTHVLLIPMNNDGHSLSAVSKAGICLVGANETLRKEMRQILFHPCINEIYIYILPLCSPEELTGKRFDPQNISLLLEIGMRFCFNCETVRRLM